MTASTVFDRTLRIIEKDLKKITADGINRKTNKKKRSRVYRLDKKIKIEGAREIIFKGRKWTVLKDGMGIVFTDDKSQIFDRYLALK
jgi:hypothetical protein